MRSVLFALGAIGVLGCGPALALQAEFQCKVLETKRLGADGLFETSSLFARLTGQIPYPFMTESFTIAVQYDEGKRSSDRVTVVPALSVKWVAHEISLKGNSTKFVGYRHYYPGDPENSIIKVLDIITYADGYQKPFIAYDLGGGMVVTGTCTAN